MATVQELEVKISANIGEFTKGMANAGAASQKLAGELPKVVQGSNRANVALTNLGRVVSDAPFGLIGIANNIDPLLSSFQSLQREAGGTGGALKSLASALRGPAGLAIGVTAVTSALIAFGPALSNAVSGLSQFEKASVDAARAGGEAFFETKSKLEGFVTVLNNSAASSLQQELALKGLNGELSKYGVQIGSVTDAQRVAGQAASLLAQIRATEAKQTAIAALAAQEYAKASALSVTAAKGNLIDVLGQLGTGNQLKLLLGVLNGLPVGVSKLNALAGELENTSGKLDAYEDLSKGLRQELFGLTSILQSLEGVQQRTTTATTKAADAQRKQNEEVRKSINLQSVLATLPLPKAVVDLSKLQAPLSQVRAQLGAIQQTFAAMDAANLNNALRVTDILANSIFTTFQGLEQGQDIFRSIGNSVKALISQLAQAAVKALIFKAILSAIPGLGAAAGSTGFLGTFLRFAGFNPNGGSIGGATPGSIAINVQGGFRVQGRDLVAAIAANNQSTGRIG